jgi:phospholipid/cholesterol/gamma-HCH transport system substrate-binding protein
MERSKALTWTELRVGVVVILSLATLAATIVYIGGEGGSPFSPRFVVKALMTDVNGLKPGAPVRVGGVEVGNVIRVDFSASGGMVEVAMRLDRRVQPRLTTESRASLGALGLLGEKAVDITSSDRGQPVQDGGYLVVAAEDPFKGLLSDASDSTAHLRRILARMDAGEGLIGKTLRDEELYTRLVDVSVRLQGVLTKLESTEGPLGRLMNDREMSRELASSAKGIQGLVSRVESGEGTLGMLSKDAEFTGHLKDLVSHLNDVAGHLDKGEGSAGRLLRDDTLARKLETLSGRLDSIMAEVEKGQGTVGRVLRDPELYQNLNGTLKELGGLVADVRKDPRKYLRVKVSLF